MADLHSTTGFAPIQGAPLYYEVAGQGYPLILLHAGVADSSMWDDQFSIFARQFRTIRYDLRGFGKSEIPAAPFANHEDTAELLRFLNVEKAHVIGLSFGGRIALDFTLAHPEMVASLVLVASSISGYPTSADIQRFFEEEETLLERGDLAAATELNLRMWVDGPKRTPNQVNPTVRQRVYDMQYHAFTVPTPEGAEELELEPPAITRLTEIRVPTLIIVGDHDMPDVIAHSELLAAQISNAQHVIIPGVAHMVNMEQPEEFTRIVLDFLSR